MKLLHEHLLSVLIALPVLGALATAFTPRAAVRLQNVLGLATT
jgi:hypothetical protein